MKFAEIKISVLDTEIAKEMVELLKESTVIVKDDLRDEWNEKIQNFINKH